MPLRRSPALPTRTRSNRATTQAPLSVVLAILTAALLGACVLGVTQGSVFLPLGDVWAVILNKLGLAPAGPDLNVTIVWEYRIPRVLAAALVGAGLTVSGIALQGLVRNPLADPYVIGVSSGASFGAVLVMVVGSSALFGLGVPAAAFAGSIIVLFLVVLLAQRGGSFSDSRLILAGVAIGYLASAGTSFVQLQAEPGRLSGILFWTLGSVSGARWSSLLVPAVAIVACTLLLLTRARTLNALALGDDAAIAVGVDVRRERMVLLVVAALCTAVTVSLAGGIGFVGLIVPHAARLLVGADHRRLLPAGLLLGAAFLVLVDLVARTIASPVEFPLTIFTAVVGVPFFLFLMLRDRTR